MRLTRVILSLCAIALTAMAAWAVPANPKPIKVKQPDGTQITVKVRGDEDFNYTLSEDDYLVMVGDDDYYVYGNVNAKGDLVPSDVRVSPKQNRTDTESKYLQSIDRQRVNQALARQAKQVNHRRTSRAKSNNDRGAKAQAAAPATASNTSGFGLFSGTANFPSEGDHKSIVVLVEFRDAKFKLSDPYAYFHAMLNEPGFSQYGGTGSVRDYFIDNSNGKFRPQFDVYGPITLSKNRAHYGGNYPSQDANAYQMAIEACQQLDPTVDFSEYDRNNDGVIDNVFVIFAGESECNTRIPNLVWPHKSNVSGHSGSSYSFDGKVLDPYGCANEWEGRRPDAIGTFTHEFSHVLGLPDTYEVTYSTGAFTPQTYDIMDGGCYNNDGRTPCNYTVVERYALGWIEPEVIDGPMDGRLEAIHKGNAAYIIPTGDPNEFFLLENRQQQGWDSHIPGHGMLIWHVDFDQSVWDTNQVNYDPNHQRVDVEEADNIKSNLTVNADAFPGPRNITEFTDDTSPGMQTWRSGLLGLPITDIKETPEGWIEFRVAGGNPDPPAQEDETEDTEPSTLVDPVDPRTMPDASEVEPISNAEDWGRLVDAWVLAILAILAIVLIIVGWLKRERLWLALLCWMAAAICLSNALIALSQVL